MNNNPAEVKDLPHVLPDSTCVAAPDAEGDQWGSVVERYQAALQQVQVSELERLYRRLPALDESSRAAIRGFSDIIVGKMLHTPMEPLRSEASAGNTSQPLLDGLRVLFRLGK